jgi:2',3'-cyclic-nucleotide 2'-phosphodiesterase (5'-nucleotidase family)
VVVDAGDLLFSVPKPNEAQLRNAQEKMALIVDAYNASGYDAVNVGINDLAQGTDFIAQFTNAADFPFLSANIVNENNELIFQPFTIIERAGQRIGIAGVTAENPFSETVRVQDVYDSAQRAFNQMKNDVDFTVLLASVYNPEAERLMDSDIGYDLIIRSHSPRLSRTLTRAESGLFLSTGTQGRVMQLLEISQLSDGDKLTDLSMELQRLSFIESRLNEFESQAGDESLESYYAQNDATLEFIRNLQEQYTQLQQQVEQTSNYAAIRIQSLGEQIEGSEEWQQRVQKFLSATE